MKKPAIYYLAKDVKYQLKETYTSRKKKKPNLASIQIARINYDKYLGTYNPKGELLGRRHRRVRRIEDTFITR